MKVKIKKISIFDFLYLSIGTIWLFLMIATSGGFTGIKTILLLLLVIVSIVEDFYKKKYISKKMFIMLFIFISYFSLELLYGIMNGFEFVISKDYVLLQYYIISPIFIVILYSIFINNHKRINEMFKLIKYITLIVVSLNIFKILSLKGVISDIDFFNLITVYNNSTNGELAIRITNEANLMFLMPVFICMFFDEKQDKKNKTIYGFIFLLGMIFSLLSGRKMLEIVIFGSFFIMVLLKLIKNFNLNRLRMKNTNNIILLFVLVPIGIYIIGMFQKTLGIDNIVQTAYKTLLTGFSAQSYGMIKRTENIHALLKMWMSSPIFGNGLNAYAIDSIANSITYWSYEVEYVALLAQIGIVGIIILLIIMINIVSKLYKNYKISNNYTYLSILFGFVSFLVCAATNPILTYIWPWAISIVFAYNKSIFLQESEK